ncbi:MAG: hypothetical protein CL678_17105 [Bdellovibrionaceae bacterium]|nr:hypothetical protein [Pseudobdellovibrionaceae bacterium]|tara:strand:- start:3497 stop:4159 length:663 start_codon:yes stop_codon:yes gene_type:complete
MEKKQNFFIYDRKEVLILLLLGTMLTAFAFTLGVHLGKKVNQKLESDPAVGETTLAKTEKDLIPDRVQLTEQMKGVEEASEGAIDRELHDEVAKTGVKLDTPRQMTLPEKTKEETTKDQTVDPAVTGVEVPAMARKLPSGRYTIQVGSYPSIQESKTQVDALEGLGLKPFVRGAYVKGKGRWYRVYLEGFLEQSDAKKAGERFVKQHIVRSFIVVSMPDN